MIRKFVQIATVQGKSEQADDRLFALTNDGLVFEYRSDTWRMLPKLDNSLIDPYLKDEDALEQKRIDQFKEALESGETEAQSEEEVDPEVQPEEEEEEEEVVVDPV